MTNTEIPAAKKARVESVDQVKQIKDDAATQQLVDQIEQQEEKLNNLIDEQSAAIIKLEQEYVVKLMPIYEERQKVIAKVPNFWTTAINNHTDLQGEMTEADLEAMKYLKEIKVDTRSKEEIVDGEEGEEPVTKTLNYSVTFVFNENPYFTDSEITKKFYQIHNSLLAECNPEKISWKEGKDLVKSADEDCESFFAWFSRDVEGSEDEIGEWIREDLWPHALNYYLNEVDDEDDDDDAEVDLEEEDEEETQE